ncbi:MAG: PepSY domain-containing protein [Planctomycetaceae bacterium]
MKQFRGSVERHGFTLRKVARDKLPGVKFDTAWTEKDGDKTVYEVRGKSSDGKTRDIKVSPEGKVLEVD